MDTDAIRRAWPNVLGRIFTMRRITWTFVSQNAQVTAFDGRTLTLGIATAGLTTTFRAGNHAEVVRQALIDELGVDALVDGVHVAEVSQQAPVAPPVGAMPPAPDDDGPERDGGPEGGGDPTGRGGPGDPGPGDPGGPTGAQGREARQPGQAGQGGPGGPPSAADLPGAAARGSWGDAGAGHDAGGPNAAPDAGPGAAPGGAARLADSGLSPVSGRSLEDNAGWGSAAGPPPDWATGPASAPAAGTPATSTHPSSATVTATPSAGGDRIPSGGSGDQGAPTVSAVRGASAVRESFAQARARASVPRSNDDDPPRPPLTDDSAVSDDDEDIEQSGDVGRAVIEKVLGGRVVQELED
jgi:DNA polymerase-3 subunit gamma/tau